jgi:hypothetical protein
MPTRRRRENAPHLYVVRDPDAAPDPPPPAIDPSGLFLDTPGREDPPDAERDLSFIDQVLAIQPVPQDVLVWRAIAPGSFELPWRELPGTLHQELSYLAVALVRYPALGAADAVLHLRVPAGIPGVYLNPFDHGDRLPAPTLLLGRGLAMFVHEVRRQDGQWYVRADLIPPPPAGWKERSRHPAVLGDLIGSGPIPGPVGSPRGPAHGRLHGPMRRGVWLVEEGGGDGR